MKSLLISMPFGSMTRPAIGISLLKAQLGRRGLSCDIRYLNLFFAKLVGWATYRELSELVPASLLLGDWIFREDLFGPDPERDRGYLEGYLLGQGALDPLSVELYSGCRRLATPFLEACMRSIAWEQYGIVGFTTTFQQTLASLALARRVKESHPHIHIVFGGANCEGVMGQELVRRFPFIDFAFSGESDWTFPALAEELLASPEGPLPALPGLIRRSASPTTSLSLPAVMVEDLDQLPFPDYSDFVDALETYGFPQELQVQFLIETSRGCWWGQRHHCTFCGLNGQGLQFRSKSPGRVLDELRYLVESYGAVTVWATDNILDTHYFETVLPGIRELGLKLHLFFETKANLRKEQLKVMREAGISWFQPGIESLNTHILGLMNKGCTALQNIQLLKWARQYGMAVTWNVLFGFPGETEGDYECMARYADAIVHLQPPSGARQIRLDRFSPYFNASGTYGLVSVAPYPSYRYIYPFESESLCRIAYFFTCEYSDSYDPIARAMPVLESVERWSQPESYSALYAIYGSHVLVITDSRPHSQERQHVLTGPESEIYLFCDRVRSLRSIREHTGKTWPDAGWAEKEIRRFLAQMVEKCLMLEENGFYLSLAVLVDSDTVLDPIPDSRIRSGRNPGEQNTSRDPAR
jgi:ribosomal peptide maturation radical SAM protein 1